MPLREFLYSAEEYAKWINRNKKDLFGEKLVQIPAPKCFELYSKQISSMGMGLMRATRTQS